MFRDLLSHLKGLQMGIFCFWRKDTGAKSVVVAMVQWVSLWRMISENLQKCVSERPFDPFQSLSQIWESSADNVWRFSSWFKAVLTVSLNVPNSLYQKNRRQIRDQTLWRGLLVISTVHYISTILYLYQSDWESSAFNFLKISNQLWP